MPEAGGLSAADSRATMSLSDLAARRASTSPLVVSCQPVPGSPLDTPATVAAMALVAAACGALAVRIEGIANVKAVRAVTSTLPIIGIVKRDLEDSSVRITPFVSDVIDLSAAGADIIAFDGTDRPRPECIEKIVEAIHGVGKLAMADCATLADGLRCAGMGVEIVGTTLSGYTGGTSDGIPPTVPDVALLKALVKAGCRVMAEGRYNTPQLAAEAVAAGAWAVTVGSAITRMEHIVGWFVTAMKKAVHSAPSTVLAVDIGGTKIACGLIDDENYVKERRQILTPTDGDGASMKSAFTNLLAPFKGRVDAVAVASTGIIENGILTALNPDNLGGLKFFPLCEVVEAALKVPCIAINDAQAAAWAEFTALATGVKDMAFLTVSTGVGGGVVLDGKLITGKHGIAGHLGHTVIEHNGILCGCGRRGCVEAIASGRAIAAQAVDDLDGMDAAQIFAKAREGHEQARRIMQRSASAIAGLITNIKAAFDVECVVLGGSVGLAEGYCDLVRADIEAMPPLLRTEVKLAHFDHDAGIHGAALWARNILV